MFALSPFAFPSISVPTSTEGINFAGVEYDPTDTTITGHSDLVVFICPSTTAPYIQDAAGLIPTTTLAANFRAISASAAREGTLPPAAVAYTEFTSASQLEIAGALSLRCLLSLTTTTDQTFIEHGLEGETEAKNILYMLKQSDEATIMFFCESGSGSNKSASWSIPGGITTTIDRPFLFSMYRTSAGVVRAYWGSWQIMHVRSTSGSASDVGDGSVSGMLATGGTSGKLTIHNNTAVQIGFVGIYNSDDSANHSTFVDNTLSGADITAADLLFIEPLASTFTTLAAETGTVSLLKADNSKSSGWSDVKGYLDGNSATQNATATLRLQKGSDTVYWVKNTAEFSTVSHTDLRIASNLTLRALVEYDDSNTYIIAHTTPSETEPKNYLYGLAFYSSTEIQVFWESGAGTNRASRFTLATAPTRGQISLISLVRHDTGSGQCNLYAYQNGTRLAVSSVSGMTNNSTHTSGPLPTGGSDGVLYVLSDDDSNAAKFGKMFHIIAGVDGTTVSEFDAREAAVALTFGLS